MIFIDANQYLDLYLMGSRNGKKLLAMVEEQRDYIFVTNQVVDEVHRNKVGIVRGFLVGRCNKLEQLKQDDMAVLDLLLSDTDSTGRDMLERFRESVGKSGEANEKFRNLAHRLLQQVSQSEDGVSKALRVIFAQPKSPSKDELKRARLRKELGNPPGKKTEPLGDQLTWEQILSQCQENSRLWIITKDKDYATKYGGKMFLNAALYRDLARKYRAAPEVFCFDKFAGGLEHFVETTRVKAEKLPTRDETQQINKEQESLPPLDWLAGYDDAAQIAIQAADRQRGSTLWAALRSQITSDEAFPPLEAKEVEKDAT